MMPKKFIPISMAYSAAINALLARQEIASPGKHRAVDYLLLLNEIQPAQTESS